MIKHETVNITEPKVISVICDICKREVLATDINEIQEFHHVHFIGGYGSIFGDGTTVDCDICQYCLLLLLSGKYRTS
jgi:hypothetical protein